MINNRQNGRRRGRGGGAPRPNGSGNGPDRGNRIDNRSRGNAAQLLEKYKALARDAQMQGDRVNAEYYLQFADHYFRVLSETRARFDEQRPRRDDHAQNDYQPQGDYQGQSYDQDDYGEETELNGNVEDRGGDRQERFERQPRFDRQDRPNRNERAERSERDQGRERFEAAQSERPEQTARDDRRDGFEESRQQRRPRGRNGEASGFRNSDNEDRGVEMPPVQVAEAQPAETPPAAAERPRRGRRPRVEAVSQAAEERIEMDRLPPAFGADAPLLAGVVEPAPAAEEKPRRRVRRPRGDAVSAEV